jgi:copper chaperone CopZ
MRSLASIVYVASLLVFAIGCERAQEPAQAAPAPAAAKTEPAAPAAQAATTAQAEEGGTCSGAMQAGGECGGGCDKWDEAASEVARRPVPADARWEEIPVQGMTCGGCERRVIANLGQLQGVLAVEADAELGTVRVAMARGSDLRGAAVERINGLGYRAR